MSGSSSRLVTRRVAILINSLVLRFPPPLSRPPHPPKVLHDDIYCRATAGFQNSLSLIVGLSDATDYDCATYRRMQVPGWPPWEKLTIFVNVKTAFFLLKLLT